MNGRVAQSPDHHCGLGIQGNCLCTGCQHNTKIV